MRNFIPKEIEYVLSLAKAALNGAAPASPPLGMDWRRLYLFAQEHDIVGMIYPAIARLPEEHMPPQNVLQILLKSYKGSIIVDSNREYEIAQLTDKFAANNVDYILLKGMVINKLYPDSFMRSMSDVDILYREYDRGSAAKCMEDMGYTLMLKSNKDDTYFKNSAKVKVELHRELVEYSMEKEYGYLSSVWDRAVRENGQYKMTDEDYYIYMVIHLAKHFYKSGTGIRQIADMYVYNKGYAGKLDKGYIDGELKKLDLLIFESKISELAQTWFGDTEADESTDMIAEYVLSSGVFGTTSRLEVNLLTKEKLKNDGGTSKLSYYIKSIFPPYRVMVGQYGSWLKKYPFLLPAAWIKINFDRLRYRRGNIKGKIKNIKGINNKNVEKRLKLFRDMGYK